MVIGDDWKRLPPDRITLCCHETGGEALDWSLLAGLWVVVVWRSGEALGVVAAICEHAARVEVTWEDNARHRWDAAALIDPPAGYRARQREWWIHQFELAGVAL